MKVLQHQVLQMYRKRKLEFVAKTYTYPVPLMFSKGMFRSRIYRDIASLNTVHATQINTTNKL